MIRTSGTLWLPFTQMENFDPSRRTFVRGEGNFLIDAQGRRVFDAVSSIWTTIHGHCHPAIVEAVARQAGRLDHATLLGATNPVAEALAERLTALLGMDYAFFSGDGASAIEAALKMTLQYWQNAGEPGRTRFVHLVDAYHGDTGAAMSVSDLDLFKARFSAVTFETYSYDGDPAILHSDDVAAIVVEPVVQAAAGMRVVPAEHYAPLAGMTPLLIVDEIATGFGRTGTMFAHEQLGLTPDIMCLGKGITGGALALSATIVRSRVYDAFLGPHAEGKQFFHGHSYAGNPIACAAALANLDVFEAERSLEHAALVAQAVRPHLDGLAANPRVREVRGCGLMFGIELDTESIGVLVDRLYDIGHFTRPIGNVVQLVPPLSSTVEEVLRFVNDVHDVLA